MATDRRTSTSGSTTSRGWGPEGSAAIETSPGLRREAMHREVAMGLAPRMEESFIATYRTCPAAAARTAASGTHTVVSTSSATASGASSATCLPRAAAASTITTRWRTSTRRTLNSVAELAKCLFSGCW